MPTNLNKKIEERLHKNHQEVLGRIRPNKSTRKVIAETIIELFESAINAINSKCLIYHLEPILVGSTAKDTYLKDPDIDLFIMFPISVQVDELREVGLALGKEILPAGEERYAEHPYIKGRFKGFDTDIVPCYKLNNINDRMTAVDRTPFHTRYITEHLEPGQCDEVRLLKQFMKGIGVYGAEIEVQGFSGYLCELLILKYHNFIKLLQDVSGYSTEFILSLKSDHINENINSIEIKNRSDLPKKLAAKYKNEPFIFIDPVDSSRNVASAVAVEKLERFIKAAWEYLKKPTLQFFFPNSIQPLQIHQLEKIFNTKPGLILGIEFQTPEAIPDVLYGQVRKCQKVIEKFLISSQFGVVYSKYFVNNKILILFELKTRELPDVELHMGPPEGHKNVKDFKSKWMTSPNAIGKPYLVNGRWYIKLKREITTPDGILKSKVSEFNLGKLINIEVEKDFKIYLDTDLLKINYLLELTDFFERKYPWEY